MNESTELESIEEIEKRAESIYEFRKAQILKPEPDKYKLLDYAKNKRDKIKVLFLKEKETINKYHLCIIINSNHKILTAPFETFQETLDFYKRASILIEYV